MRSMLPDFHEGLKLPGVADHHAFLGLGAQEAERARQKPDQIPALS